MKKLLLPIIIVLLSLVAGFYYYSNQALKITEYQDLKLGMSMDEAIYAIGEDFALTLEGIDKDSWCPTCPRVVDKDEIKKAGGIKNFVMWEYSYPESELGLVFDSKEKLISINCRDMRVTRRNFKNGLSEQCHIAGIHTQSSEDEVIEILGKPSKESLDTKSYVKTMTYKKRNLELLLSGKKVYNIYIRKIKK